MRALRADFQKVFTVRSWWILGIILALYVGFISVFMAFALSVAEVDLGGGNGGNARMVYSTALTFGYVFPLLMGALSVTGEFRHKTISLTFLTTPQRGRALLTKLTTQFFIGLLFAVIAFVAVVLAAIFVFAAYGVNAGFGETETWLLLIRGSLAMGLWAMIGVGLGSLIPNQAAVIVIALAFTQFVEPLLRTVSMIWPVTATIGNYLPGAASDAFGGYSILAASSYGGADALPWWGGALVMIGYVILFSALGYLLRWRRDVQ